MIPAPVKDFTTRTARRVEQIWLRRAYLAPRCQGTRLDLKLDFVTTPGQVRATADFTFKPLVQASTHVLVVGDISLFSATADGKPVKARVNSPFLVVRLPKAPEVGGKVSLQLRYSYLPDEYGTILQPLTRDDFPVKISMTCRRPLLGLVQGKLLQGAENPPTRTYTWEPPRCRKLNGIVADVQSFRKDTGDGMAMWLHLHGDAAPFAPRILDLLVEIYRESANAHHRKLPHADYHVVESDDRHLTPFNSSGLIVVPRGTFATSDRPSVYGVLAPEMNKEWARDPTRMVAKGQRD